MADFCKQCSIENFGEDFEDFKGAVSPANNANGLFAAVLCEGCGLCQVDCEGRCVSPDCLEKHGAKK